MSFFSQEQMQSTGSFEVSGDSLPPIPEGTTVLAICEEAITREYEGEYHISLKWRVSKPDLHNNRVIYQKVRVYDADPAKAERAKNMLAAIATNTGGKLFQAMQAGNESQPSNQSLATLTNFPVMLKLGHWKMGDKEGNWVQAVSKYERGAAPAQEAPAPQAAPAPAPAATVAPSFEDDIPFSSVPF